VQRVRPVRLFAKQAVMLERGVVLPPGRHTATKTRNSLDGVSWTAPQFTMEFTADQLASMGAKTRNSKKIDMPALVRDGQLTQR
jgi:hypothetical protein